MRLTLLREALHLRQEAFGWNSRNGGGSWAWHWGGSKPANGSRRRRRAAASWPGTPWTWRRCCCSAFRSRRAARPSAPRRSSTEWRGSGRTTPHPCGDLPALLPRFSRTQIAAQYRACLRLAPEDLRLRQAFAGFLQEGGEPEAAVALLREGLQLHPGSAVAQHAMGLALAELGA